MNSLTPGLSTFKLHTTDLFKGWVLSGEVIASLSCQDRFFEALVYLLAPIRFTSLVFSVDPDRLLGYQHPYDLPAHIAAAMRRIQAFQWGYQADMLQVQEP